MRKINYKSDFDFILKLTDCLGETVGWPDWDWEARLYTQNKANAYVASCMGGVYLNCFNDGGRIHVVVDSHRMGTGRLIVELRGRFPNGIYPDGTQDEVWPQPLEIELVAGSGDCPTTAEAEAVLPYIKGEKGDKMTYADLTEENKKDLIKPIEEKIDKAIAGKQDKLTPTEDLRITEDNIIGLTDVSKMRLFCDMFNAAAGDAGYARITDGEFDCELNKLKLTYEEAVATMSLPVMNPSNLRRLYHNVKIARTHMPPLSYMAVSMGGDTFCGSSFEVIEAGSISIDGNMFNNCKNLRHVNIYAPNNNRPTPGAWDGCIQFEDITFSAVYRISFSLKDSPLLSLSTVQRIVSKASAEGAAFTITVHPDVYAKLTDESNTEWHQVLLDAAEKSITFATI